MVPGRCKMMSGRCKIVSGRRPRLSGTCQIFSGKCNMGQEKVFYEFRELINGVTKVSYVVRKVSERC